MTKRGRPRTFDRNEALSRAMNVFWERGYEGTSISDLTEAMGINTPSLYATFESKEVLFREAIQLYNQNSPTERAMRTEPTARAAVEEMLRANIINYANPENPAGCMIVLSALRGMQQNEAVRVYLAQIRREDQAMLQRRLEQGIEEGDLSAKVDTGALAAFYITVLHGLSIQANDGASLAEMNLIVDQAMNVWDALVKPTQS